MTGSAASSLASSSIHVRPVNARTRTLPEAQTVPTPLRLEAPIVLNLLGFVGLIRTCLAFVAAMAIAG